MKSYYLICFVFCVGIYLTSCDQAPKKSNPEPPTEEVAEVGIFTPISKDTFDVWKARWDANFRSYMANDSLHYFDMPIADFRAILTETGLDDARSYLGMDSGRIPHLMIVGVQAGVPNFSIIADYTKACPPHCPK